MKKNMAKSRESFSKVIGLKKGRGKKFEYQLYTMERQKKKK